ncbi:MAG: hypothetical protein ACREHC_03710 [Candidatus Levyibacteriota bacterium]
MNTHPKFFNSNHFSTEKFPEVIAFCDRDEATHISNGTEESYNYILNGQTMYTLKKFVSQWELAESNKNNIIRVSTGRNLGLVLMQGLRFSEADKDNQEERVSILFPTVKEEVEKAMALMYYYGGYPGNFLQKTPELTLIVERFMDPTITFLSYSYVPAGYLEWLREQLTNASIIQPGATKTLWVYKK